MSYDHGVFLEHNGAGGFYLIPNFKRMGAFASFWAVWGQFIMLAGDRDRDECMCEIDTYCR